MVFFYLFSFLASFNICFLHSEDDTIQFLKNKILLSPDDSLFYNSFLNLYKSDNSNRDKKLFSNLIRHSQVLSSEVSNFDSFNFYLKDLDGRLNLDPIKFKTKFLITKDDIPWCFIYPLNDPLQIFQDIESKLKILDDRSFINKLKGADALTWATTVFKLEKYQNDVGIKINIKGIDYCFPNSKSLFYKFGSSDLRYSNNNFTDHSFQIYTDWVKNNQRFDYLNLDTDRYIKKLIIDSTDLRLKSFYTNFYALYKAGRNKTLHGNIIKNIDEIIFLQNTNVSLASLGIIGLNPGSSFNYTVALVLTKQKNIWVFAYPFDNTPVAIFETIQKRLVNVEKYDFKNSMNMQDANSWAISLFKLKNDAGGGVKNGINIVSFKKIKDPVKIPDITSKLILDNFGSRGYYVSKNDKSVDSHFKIFIDWSEHFKNNHKQIVEFLINNFPNNKTTVFVKTPEGQQQISLNDLIINKKIVTYLEPHQSSSFNNLKSVLIKKSGSNQENAQIVFLTRNPKTTFGDFNFRNDEEFYEFKKDIYDMDLTLIQIEGPPVDFFLKLFDFEEYTKPSVGYHILDYENTSKLKFPIFGD